MTIFITERDRSIPKNLYRGKSVYYSFPMFYGGIVVNKQAVESRRYQYISPEGDRCHFFNKETYHALKKEFKNVEYVEEKMDSFVIPKNDFSKKSTTDPLLLKVLTEILAVLNKLK